MFGGHVEQLATACAPLWILASSRRNLFLAARLWKGVDIDLVPSGDVRLVRYAPRARLRGETAIRFVGRRSQVRLRLGAVLQFAFERHGQNPNVILGIRRVLRVQNPLAVAGPVGESGEPWPLGDEMFVTDSVRLLANQTRRIETPKQDCPAVWRPEGSEVPWFAGCERAGESALGFPQPDMARR